MDDASGAAAFARLFGAPPALRAEAPGRVNLIGEHTDYQQGFVLPALLPQRTVVHVSPSADGRVRVASLAMNDGIREFAVGAETRRGDWLDYVQGVTWGLRRSARPIPGATIVIESTLPQGAGVSSSAALEVALLRALRDAFALQMGDVELALLAQSIENDFVGASVGIMDQMACSVGRKGHALFLDTRSLAVEHLPMPDSAALVVIDSGLSHRHAGGEYAHRRAESFAAAEALGVRYLRDVEESAMPRLERLPPLLRRRARHVITENQRVLAAVVALKAADPSRLGALFNASHASMRDDYEVSIPEIDLLVSIGQQDSDVYGARMTGGGFGGAVVLLARPGREHDVAARVLADYQNQTGQIGRVLVPLPRDGGVNT